MPQRWLAGLGNVASAAALWFASAASSGCSPSVPTPESAQAGASAASDAEPARAPSTGGAADPDRGTPNAGAPVGHAPASALDCPEGMVAIEGSAEFQLGPHRWSDGAEVAPTTVQVPSHCQDRTEVTADAYAACVAAGHCPPARTGLGCTFERSGHGGHPINCVTFAQANDYCKAQGKRLPTHAEWELAAKGGAAQRRYPWGAEAPSAELVNGCGPACLARFEAGESADYEPDDPWLDTAPVGSFPAGHSRDGLADLAGNVAEWTSSSKCADGTAAPSCPSSQRIVRGGGYDPQGGIDRFTTEALGAVPEDTALPHIGFRCAM